MRGRNHDEHAGFSHGEAAETVYESHAVNAELGPCAVGDFVHLLQRHFLIGFVIEMERLAATRVIADDAVEDDNGAIFGTLGELNQGFGVDGIAG